MEEKEGRREKAREGEKGKYERKRKTYKENNFNFKCVCVCAHVYTLDVFNLHMQRQQTVLLCVPQ